MSLASWPAVDIASASALTYLGIDQGPILIGLENHRSGRVWDWFCRGAATGPIVRRGFRPVGPAGAWLGNPQGAFA